MKQTTRRALVAGTAGAAGALALVACGAGGSTSEAPAASALTGSLTFWHWGDQTYLERYRNLASEFQKRNPKISVEVVLHSSGIVETLIAAISGGDPPNTFVHDFQRAQGWGKQGLVEALDERAKRSKVIKLSEFSKIALDAITHKGKLQGPPGVAIPGAVATAR